MNKTTTIFTVIIAVLLGVIVFSPKAGQLLQGVSPVSQVYTTSAGFTEATTTINTTSTQFVSSINQLVWLVNTTNAQITCSLDGRGTTAASSSVAAGRGVIIAATSTGNPAPSVSFGQCIPGVRECYPHIGAINCLASAAATVAKLTQ